MVILGRRESPATQVRVFIALSIGTVARIHSKKRSIFLHLFW